MLAHTGVHGGGKKKKKEGCQSALAASMVKEGVDGSSPSEGSRRSLPIRPFV